MKKILFQGDSITDCERKRDDDVHVGNGYASLVKAYLGFENPGEYQFYNKGISGNRIVDLYARSKTKGKVITKIKRIDYDDVIAKLELDTIINPKNITADLIAKYVRSAKNTRGSNMENFYSLIKGKVEASEFIVRGRSKIIGKSLCELKFKENVLISAILRDNEVIIPRKRKITSVV